MLLVLTWYLGLQLFAFAAWPIAFSVCDRLPDRGYGLSKGLGLLLVTYLTWVLAHLTSAWPALGFSFQTVSASWYALILLSVVLIARHSGEMWRFLRRKPGYVLTVELVMAGTFALMVGLRAMVPHISYYIPNPLPGSLADNAAEKFMDFAILNSLLTSRAFPPHDAWVSGMTLNYYYFGHMLWATLIKFCSIRPEIGFNLALASVFSLCSTLAYALGYNLTGRKRWGFLLLFLICLCSNLDGFLQLLTGLKTAFIDSGNENLYYFNNRSWWQNYSFWRSSRAIAGTITEFPVFSFILGDLHAHLSALMISLCGWNIIVQMFRSVRRYPSLWRYEVHAFDELFLAALICGALSATNSWDVPLFAGGIALALWCGGTGRRDPYAWTSSGERMAIRGARAAEALIVAGIVAIIGVAILFGQFLWNFRAPDPAKGFIIKTVSYMNRSDFLEFAAHWAVLGTIPVVFLVTLFRSQKWRKSVRSGPRGLALMLALAAMAIVLVPLWQGWVSTAMAMCAVLLAAVLLSRHLPPLTRWIVGMALMFCVMTVFCELFYVDDVFEGTIERINTVFKVYFGLWPLMAVVTVLSMRLLIRFANKSGTGILPVNHVARTLKARRWRTYWMLAPLLVVGSPYMILGSIDRYSSATRLGHWTPPQDSMRKQPPAAMLRPEARAKNLADALDGLRYLSFTHPDDYAALMWARSNMPPDAILLEAAGGQYTYSGRFGTITGRPSFDGWLTHSWGWRGAAFGDPENPNNERARRTDVAAAIYNETDPKKAREMLRRDHIQYVIVGKQEREQYPVMDALKFAEIGKRVFSHGTTTIYKLTPKNGS